MYHQYNILLLCSPMSEKRGVSNNYLNKSSPYANNFVLMCCINILIHHTIAQHVNRKSKLLFIILLLYSDLIQHHTPNLKVYLNSRH